MDPKTLIGSIRNTINLPSSGSIYEDCQERERFQDEEGAAILVVLEKFGWKPDSLSIEKGIHSDYLDIIKEKISPYDRYRVPFLRLDEVNPFLANFRWEIDEWIDLSTPKRNKPIFNKL